MMRENLPSCTNSTHMVYRRRKKKPDPCPPHLSNVTNNSLEKPPQQLTEEMRGIAHSGTNSGTNSTHLVYHRRKDMPNHSTPDFFNVTNNSLEKPPQQLTEETMLRGISHRGTNSTHLVYRRRKNMPDLFPPPTASNSSDKQKSRAGQQLHPVSSSLPVNHSPRGGPVKGDASKSSNVGKLHFLKPVREKNGVTPVVKDNLSPKSGAPATNAAPERKPILTVFEKRPTFQAQSRNDFFNLVRKKSIADTSSVADPATANSSESPSFSDKIAPITPRDDVGSSSIIRSLSGDHLSEERVNLTCNGDVQKCVVNGKNHSGSDPIISEEEETAFLRSLGWEENSDEGGLTEEEINGFYRDVAKYISSKPSLRIPQAVQPKFSVPFDSQIGGISGISSGLSSSDAKLES
ncbi:hypothetical protein BUALT_Bualt15G0077800 [Buddleja alternifolia]|uniref:Uncharacterized protein n=1 Tax=Buddleja alternifolia TaxID=168488 RepID=A0AAV6WDG8_9LAMI|nr:hypothetical protein BUALT_Bualt15G0077800 [Buddleja alternifolia]